MNGETNLAVLLKSMKPRLNKGTYVFCVVNDKTTFPKETIGSFHETEGITLILPKDIADQQGYTYTGVFTWISLTVHSSLEAVGLTAAFSRALADKGISCNVVAAYYHDHIFVPVQEASRALEILKALAG